MKRKFAAFDIDGTIYRNSLFLQIVDQLIRDGLLPQDARQKLDEKLEAYKNRAHMGAFKEYSSLSVDVLFSNMQKIPVEGYRHAVDTILKHTKQHTYVYTRELIKKLKSEGYFLIALSGSEMYAVQEFTRQFDFDIAIGELYEEKNGYFTGKAEEVFHKKERFLAELIPKHNLTRAESIAVGDSAGDTTMLAYVEQAIAFNPEDTLYHQAIEHGWKIVIERKNVIYELEPTNGSYILAQAN